MTEMASGRVGQYMWRTWNLEDGIWNDVRGFRTFTVDAIGVTSPVRLYASNRTSDGGGHLIGADIITDGLTEIVLAVGYLRAETTDGSPLPKLTLMGVE